MKSSTALLALRKILCCPYREYIFYRNNDENEMGAFSSLLDLAHLYRFFKSLTTTIIVSNINTWQGIKKDVYVI